MADSHYGGIWPVYLVLIRHYYKHPFQVVFLLAGITLGTSILVSVNVVNDVALDSYQRAEKLLASVPQYKLLPLQRRQTFDQGIYSDLRRGGVAQLFPVLEGTLYLDDGRTLKIKGVDPLAVSPLNKLVRGDVTLKTPAKTATNKAANTASMTLPGAVSLMDFILPPHVIVCPKGYAALNNITDKSELILADGQRVGNIILVDDSEYSGMGLLADITLAQQLLGKQQQLTEILAFSLTREQQQRIELTYGDKIRIVDLEREDEQRRQLSRSFGLNIQAMGGLAFVIGLFISYNALHFSLLQRQFLVCRMRSLGVSVQIVIMALCLEFTGWILVASTLGSLVGQQLAGIMLPGAAVTMHSLFDTPVGTYISWQWSWLWQAVLLTTVSAILALGLPLYQLATTSLLWLQQWQFQHQQILRWHTVQVRIAMLLVVLTSGILLLPGSQWQALLTVSCVMLIFALVLPQILTLLLRGLEAALIRFDNLPLSRWLLADAQHVLSRSSLAMMAFLLAMSASVGVNTMVGSFRLALTGYLDHTLKADVYLKTHGQQATELIAWLNQQTAVSYVTRYRHQQAEFEGFTTTLLSLADDPREKSTLVFKEHNTDLWPSFFSEKKVLISESLALRTGKRLGEPVVLKLGKDSMEYQVSGIFYDYGNPVGKAIIAEQQRGAVSASTQTKLSIQTTPTTQTTSMATTGLGIYLNEQTSDEVNHVFYQSLLQRFSLQPHQVRWQKGLKSLSLSVFERTFVITHTLNTLILLVAAIGIFCALSAMVFERQHQIATARSMGLSQWHLFWGLLLQQGMLTGLTALMAVPVGLLLSWLLVNQVNYQAFGWTMPMSYFPGHYLDIWLMGALCSVLGSLMPLWRLSRVGVDQCHREGG